MLPATVATGAKRGGGAFSQQGGGTSDGRGGGLESIYNLLPKFKEENVSSRVPSRVICPFLGRQHVEGSEN